MATAEALFGWPISILSDDDPVPENPIPEELHPEEPEEGDMFDVIQEMFLTDELKKLKLKELRELAQILGVSQTGNKSTLVTRMSESSLPMGMDQLPEPFAHLSSMFPNSQ